MPQAMISLDQLLPELRTGDRVLVRVDFNVPLSEDGQVLDDTRLRESLDTIEELSERGARVVLVSHCGRPGGRVDLRYSLRPVAARLADLLGREVVFGEDCVGESAHRAVDSLQPGGVVLLENLRFHPGETSDDPAELAAFADRLAELADAYVGNAFGTAHRAHASVVAVAYRCSRRAAGRLMMREVDVLSSLLGEPARPFVGMLGGAKISGKIDTLSHLLPRLDRLLVGGGMANTFLAAGGARMGRSLVEAERLSMAKEILARATSLGTEVRLPVDLVVAPSLETTDPAAIRTVAVEEGVPDEAMALDIGPKTRRMFVAALEDAQTLFWNGPLGVFERPPFDRGTREVAGALARCPGLTVIGGGETVAAVHQAGVADLVGHVSTGGGASLELLAGQELPGVAALRDRNNTENEETDS